MRARSPDLQEGDYIEEPLEPVEFGRIGAQAAKQAILQKIRDAEREQVLNDFLDRGETIISGTIKRMDKGDCIVETGKIEARLPRTEMIPKENLRVGDRVRALCCVSITPPVASRSFCRAPRPSSSASFRKRSARDRAGPARDQGCRPRSGRARQDCRGGLRQAHRSHRHLRGHARFARDRRAQRAGRRAGRHRAVVGGSGAVRDRRAGPANVESIVVDEDKHAMDVVVDEENLPKAIGAKGQNVRLASELTGWQINIMTPEESLNRQENERASLRATFMDKLDVDEEVADILIDEASPASKKSPMSHAGTAGDRGL